MASVKQPDLSEFFKLSKPKRKPCAIGFALSTKAIEGAEVDQLNAALATDQGIITASAIQQWLASRGVDVNVNVVSSHRRRTCSCNG